MQIVKGLGRLQEQTLAASTQATPATGAEEKTGDESAPMEVDKDTGGVRHSKAEQYLPKIPMLNYEKMVSRSSEINYWTEYVEAISSWLARLLPSRALQSEYHRFRCASGCFGERPSCKKLEVPQPTQAKPRFFPAWSGCCATSRTAADGCSVWV